MFACKQREREASFGGKKFVENPTSVCNHACQDTKETPPLLNLPLLQNSLSFIGVMKEGHWAERGGPCLQTDRQAVRENVQRYFETL